MLGSHLRFPFTAALASAAGLAACAAASPPTKVVIVVEENHAFEQVIGSLQAPYINALANAGAHFTNMYGLTHPSQPNYLELFSGANQGVTTNSVPAGIPFNTANLGAEVLAAGNTFACYSDGLPSTGSNIEIDGDYVRKHNPSPNWQSLTPTANQFLPSLNRRFVDFPSDFSQLPTVSFVIPDLQHDMHDGTINQADVWLEQNLAAYVQWAAANNAMLIITWDEDSSANGNRIPTIFHGPMVRTGSHAGCYTLHNILRTLEDWYGVGHAGAAASVRPIIGVLSSDPVVTTTSFSYGSDGYAQSADTYIESAAPTTSRAATTPLVADGSPLSQVLVRFDDIIGPGADQVPAGATVVSAKLRVQSTDSSANTMSIHRMIAPWTAASTWTSLTGGVSTDNVEAASAADFTTLPNTSATWAVLDVTSSVQAFASGAEINNGWVIVPSGTDGWRFASNEAALASRPRLEVTYYVPACPSFDTQPQPVVSCPGATVTLTAAVSGNPPPTLQWRKDGGPLVGQTGATLIIAPASTDDTGVYDCIATSACGPVPSDSALVQVCLANVNCDSMVDLNDLFDFLNCFDQTLSCADVNGQNGVDLSDFFDFLNAFDGGC